MVWAGFSGFGRLKLAFVTCKMNSAEYVEVLEESLLPYIKEHRNQKFIYQQDNARIHVSKYTKEWLLKENIPTLSWPAHSPDCNPMENLWGIMTEQLFKRGRQYNSCEELRKSILECWNNLPEETITNLVESMNDRIFELIEKKGYKIHY